MPKLTHRLWRTYLRLRFYLLQRRRYDRLVLEEVLGRPFLILPQVFNPTLFLTSEFMIRALNPTLIPVGSRVLDMGTGSGVGAVFAAQWAQRVIAVDVNPLAVRCARINAILNEVDDRLQVRQSDLFGQLDGTTFDVILFNPPYFKGQPKSSMDRAFRADDVIERFASEVGDYLAPSGHILLLLSEAAADEEILALFGRNGYMNQTVAQRKVSGETLYLYRLRRRPSL